MTDSNMSQQKHILVTQQDRVTTITFNRADKKNALTRAMYTDVVTAMDEASKDNTRVLIFTGAGDCFTAGNDIKDFMQAPPTGEDSPVSQFLARLLSYEKPIIAAVPGLAIGVGTTMLLHCDFVLASAQATFKLPFVDLALVPEAGSSYLLPQLIGQKKAAEFLLEGREFDAAEAADIGLINKSVPHDKLIEVALDLATVIATKPPEAIRLTKELLRRNWTSAAEAMSEEGKLFMARLQSPEAMEAFTAFMERRAPDFSKFE